MATAAAFQCAMKVALLVKVKTRPMTTAPPIEKNITNFCASEKNLMPKTTNRKPMKLKMLAITKISQLWLLM